MSPLNPLQTRVNRAQWHLPIDLHNPFPCGHIALSACPVHSRGEGLPLQQRQCKLGSSQCEPPAASSGEQVGVMLAPVWGQADPPPTAVVGKGDVG